MIFPQMDPQDLKQNYKQLVRIFDKQEKRLRYHVKKAHVSTISYLVIQILILSLISQNSSNVKCKNWWLPFTLSLLVAVIYFVLFVETVKKCYMIQYFSDVNLIEQQELFAQISGERNHSSKVDVETGDLYCYKMLKPDAFQLLGRKICIGLIMVVLTVFTFVILLSCRLVLCDV